MLDPIPNCVKTLKDDSISLEDKYEAMYALRTIPTEEACFALRECYPYLGTSELLKHELMYILGQNRYPSSLDFLIKSMHDETEAPVVRHEAGEALSNFSDYKDMILPELKKHLNSNVSVLKSTVEIAIRKMESFNPNANNYNQYVPGTSEPAEPFTEEQLSAYLNEIGKTEKDILEVLVDSSIEEYKRYQILYSLRLKKDEKSAVILASLLKEEYFDKVSELLRHEVAFVLGQLSQDANYPEVKKLLGENIQNQKESPIVRHEAIMAYVEIFGHDELIENQKKDGCDLVNQSAYVVDPSLQH